MYKNAGRGTMGVFFGVGLLTAVAAVAAPDAFEPDNTFGEANPLTVGEVRAHSISGVGDVDFFSFTLTEDTRVEVKTTNDFSGGIPFLRLFHSDGGALNSDFESVAQMLEPGNYLVSVEDDGNDEEIDSYTILLSQISTAPDVYEVDSTPALAHWLNLGDSQPGHTLAPAGDQDWYRFTVPWPSKIVIQAAAALGVTRIQLFSDISEPLTPDVSANGTRIVRDLDAGEYHVRVLEDTGSSVTAEYTLHLWDAAGPDAYENDDTPAQASFIGTQSPKQTHNFHDEGDQDWIRFYGLEGEILAVKPTAIGTDASPMLTLFRADGVTPILDNVTQFEWPVDVTGFFLIRATNNPESVFGLDTVYTIGVPLQPPGIIPGTLIGVVRSGADNNPIANAQVELLNFGALTALTDERGIYVFPALPVDTYTVIATAERHVEAQDIVGVGSGSTNLDLVLEAVFEDIDQSGQVNAIDVQLVINGALGIDIGGLDADVNADAAVNAIDVQLVINAALAAK